MLKLNLLGKLLDYASKKKLSVKQLLLIAGGGFVLYKGVGFIHDWILEKQKGKTRAKSYSDKTDDDIRKQQARTDGDIKKGHAAAEDKINVKHEATENKIKEFKAKASVDYSLFIKKQQVRMQYKHNAQVSVKEELSSESPNKDWISEFCVMYDMPKCSDFSIIRDIIPYAPFGYREPLILSTLTNLGARCFSKVRASKGGNKKQSPSLQTVIEGDSGAGKGYFMDVNNALFERCIARDNKNLQDASGKKHIIQTIGIGTTRAKLFHHIANNNGIHLILNETEIEDLEKDFKKGKGLSYIDLRKAFSNETVNYNVMNKDAINGSFKMYLNCVLTGTTSGVDSFFNNKEVHGGTAQRFCFSVIPEFETKLLRVIPEAEQLIRMQDMIDDYRSNYCCYQDGAGNDVACNETTIDLTFLEVELDRWTSEQTNKQDKWIRNKLVTRVEDIAFRIGMVLYMLADCPDSTQPEKRQSVIDMSIYLANYCMERDIYKLSKVWKKQPSSPQMTQCVARYVTEDEIKAWYDKYGTYDENGEYISYPYIGKRIGANKDSVRNAMQRYIKKYQLPSKDSSITT